MAWKLVKHCDKFCLLTRGATARSRVLLEKLIVSQVLTKPTFHYCVHKTPLLAPVLSHRNKIYAVLCLFKVISKDSSKSEVLCRNLVTGPVSCSAGIVGLLVLYSEFACVCGGPELG
jgi:hypothetical protein